MKIAVLAVQGAFVEHEEVLHNLGIETVELRKKEDLKKNYNALILPGGESTVQGKLLRELDMFEILRKEIYSGLPVMATCAGLILLAERLSNDSKTYFGTFPVTVKRNAYGRQLGSFYREENFKRMGIIPMKFIRAPYIETADAEVEILAEVDGNIVAAGYHNQLAMSFHPELCSDTSVHEYFISHYISKF